MITQALLTAGKKDLQPKAPRPRAKHKGYRELLGLDRPKKRIHVESDDDNDDFLERLLKE